MYMIRLFYHLSLVSWTRFRWYKWLSGLTHSFFSDMLLFSLSKISFLFTILASCRYMHLPFLHFLLFRHVDLSFFVFLIKRFKLFGVLCSRWVFQILLCEFFGGFVLNNGLISVVLIFGSLAHKEKK